MLAHKSPTPGLGAGAHPEGVRRIDHLIRVSGIFSAHAAFPKIVSSSTPCLVIDFSMDADRADDALSSGRSFSLPPTFSRERKPENGPVTGGQSLDPS